MDEYEKLVEVQELLLQAVELLRTSGYQNAIRMDLLGIIGTEGIYYRTFTLEDLIQRLEDAMRD